MAKKLDVQLKIFDKVKKKELHNSKVQKFKSITVALYKILFPVIWSPLNTIKSGFSELM